MRILVNETKSPKSANELLEKYAGHKIDLLSSSSLLSASSSNNNAIAVEKEEKFSEMKKKEDGGSIGSIINTFD